MKSRDRLAGTICSNIRKLRLDPVPDPGSARRTGRGQRPHLGGDRKRGRANASLATLGAIADALGVDFGRLTQPQQPGAVRTARTADAAVAWSDDRGSEARLVLVSREPQSAELWHWLLKPAEAQPDPDGTDVLIMVTRGALDITVDGQTSQFAAGTAGHITSGTGYTLANPSRAIRHSCSGTSRAPPPAPGTPRPGLQGRQTVHDRSQGAARPAGVAAQGEQRCQQHRTGQRTDCQVVFIPWTWRDRDVRPAVRRGGRWCRRPR